MHPPGFTTSYRENICHEYVLLRIHVYSDSSLIYYQYTMYQDIIHGEVYANCTGDVKPSIIFVSYQMTRICSIAQYTLVCA